MPSIPTIQPTRHPSHPLNLLDLPIKMWSICPTDSKTYYRSIAHMDATQKHSIFKDSGVTLIPPSQRALYVQ